MFIVAENEELMRNTDNGQRAFERAVGPKQFVTIPGSRHLGFYGEARAPAEKLAIDGFNQSPKAPK